MATIRYFCTIFISLIEEIFSYVSTKFYCKILKTLKVMKFLRKISKFQINQAYKTKTFFSKFLFFIQAYKTGICLRNIKPTYRSRQIRQLKIVLEPILNDLPQEPIKKAVIAFRKRLQACIRADGGHFEHLLSYISNQYSRPSHKNRPLQGPHII